MLAALTEISGSFYVAVAAAHTVLRIHGRVLPATADGAVLVAEMQDGSVVAGETAVARDRRSVGRLRLEPAAPPNPDAVRAIETASIVLGPGSLFTSILPPLLVPGIRDAVLGAAPRLRREPAPGARGDDRLRRRDARRAPAPPRRPPHRRHGPRCRWSGASARPA